MDLTEIGELIEEIKYLEKEDVEFSKKCSKIIIDIQNEKLSIIQLIEHLGALLTNPSPSKRELGVIILTNALENLSTDSLNSQQLTVLCKFYADRLKDHHQVIPAALKGIIALSNSANFPAGSATLISNAIFNNIACQQQQQPDRLQIYTIFKQLLQSHKAELCSMGLDFVYGVITAIDSERDPKNLLFLFKWIPTFLGAVSLGHLTEEMFEVLACYFPVDFRAPPQDPNVLTREDLSETLCYCLCAISEFAEFCIPLALEKLDSSLLIAKIDSLKLLKEGCRNFNVESYAQSASEIWSLIQKELFNCKDADLENNCLETLTHVIKKLSTADSATFTNILRDITDTVKGNLLPDAKLFQPSIKLFYHVALACEESAVFIVKEIVPILTNTYNITETVSQKTTLLKPLVGFLQAYSIFNSDIQGLTELCDIPTLCLKASIDVNTDLSATGYECILSLIRFLPPDIRNTLYKNLACLLPKDSPIRKITVDCFRRLSEEYPSEVIECILKIVDIQNDYDLRLYLQALCEIADLPLFTEIVVDNLTYRSLENNQLKSVALENMHQLLKKQGHNESVQKLVREKFFSNFIQIINLNQNGIKDDKHLLEIINNILKAIVGYYTSDCQQTLVNTYFCSIQHYKVMNNNLYVVLLNGLLTRLHKEVQFDSSVMNDLVQESLISSDVFLRGYAVKLLATLINKHPDDATLAAQLTVIKEKCRPGITKEDNIVGLLTWVTKALVMKNSLHMSEWEDMLVEYLGHDANIAQGFRIIMSDSCESLSFESHCNISLLYKQKFFTSVTNKLNNGYTSHKSSYLKAVGYLVEMVPNPVLLMQFVKLKRLILLCLEQCDDPEVLCVLLNSLKTFISNGEKLMEDHLEDFLTRFLKLIGFEQSMKVRIAALRCIQEVTGKYPIYKLLPLKQQVINRLAASVDDKKRMVRKEAVQARSLWYLLDAPL